MIEEQPAFRGFDRNGPGADLGRLPAAFGAHHKAVFPPVDHVRALADVDVAEWRVAVIARSAEHHVLAVDLAREQHAVAVEGQQRVLQEVELLEIVRVPDPDRRAVIAVAPGHVIAVLQPHHPRVVAVLELADFGIVAQPFDRVVIQLPADPVLAEASMQVHHAGAVVGAEDAGKGSLERNHGAVEDAVGGGDQVARNDRVAAVAPDDVETAGGLFLPGDVGQGGLGHGLIAPLKVMGLFGPIYKTDAKL